MDKFIKKNLNCFCSIFLWLNKTISFFILFLNIFYSSSYADTFSSLRDKSSDNLKITLKIYQNILVNAPDELPINDVAAVNNHFFYRKLCVQGVGISHYTLSMHTALPEQTILLNEKNEKVPFKLRYSDNNKTYFVPKESSDKDLIFDVMDACDNAPFIDVEVDDNKESSNYKGNILLNIGAE